MGQKSAAGVRVERNPFIGQPIPVSDSVRGRLKNQTHSERLGALKRSQGFLAVFFSATLESF